MGDSGDNPDLVSTGMGVPGTGDRGDRGQNLWSIWTLDRYGVKLFCLQNPKNHASMAGKAASWHRSAKLRMLALRGHWERPRRGIGSQKNSSDRALDRDGISITLLLPAKWKFSPKNSWKTRRACISLQGIARKVGIGPLVRSQGSQRRRTSCACSWGILLCTPKPRHALRELDFIQGTSCRSHSLNSSNAGRPSR